MRIATWNVNSLRTRLDSLLIWLAEAKPDVVCLQETKVVDESFPRAEIEAQGYAIEAHGQKSYNGVALLSKRPLSEVRRGLPGDEADAQARYIEARVEGEGGQAVRVASIYLPNGNPVGTDKYPYKLAWMARLHAHAQHLLALEEPLVLAGDYNVIPAERDVHNPAAWAEDALFRPDSRRALRRLLTLGLYDALRLTTDAGGRYTFWDYQNGAYARDNGIRIDHLLLSAQAADRLRGFAIDRHIRGWEKPSDHVPVRIDLVA